MENSRRSLWTLSVALLGAFAGCGDFQKAMEKDRAPVTLPGMAPVDALDPTSAPPAAAAATNDPAAGAPTAPAGAEPTPPPPSTTEPPVAAPNQASNTGIIGKVTGKVVDKAEAMAANPNLVEVPNTLQGGDPISLAASAYINIRSRASTLGFQNELKTFKALNDRYPTYAELTAMMKQYHVEFAMLPPYQTYGYDAKTGSLVILEDKADKAKRYQAAGIPLD